MILPEVISNSITVLISNHFHHFLFAPSILSHWSCQKSKICERCWSKFIHHNFIFDYFDKDWFDVLQSVQKD